MCARAAWSEEPWAVGVGGGLGSRERAPVHSEPLELLGGTSKGRLQGQLSHTGIAPAHFRYHAALLLNVGHDVQVLRSNREPL